jgi:RimJ/RimL family protein N-acetyltransferase
VLPLESPRLVLRRFTPEDVPALAAYRNEPEVSRYQSWESFGIEAAAALVGSANEPLTPGDWFQIAFVLRESGALVGDCGLKVHESEPRHATIGITLSPEYQHRGLAAESLSCLFDHLFTKTEVRRVVADTDPDNSPSWRLSSGSGCAGRATFAQTCGSRAAGRTVTSMRSTPESSTASITARIGSRST